MSPLRAMRKKARHESGWPCVASASSNVSNVQAVSATASKASTRSSAAGGGGVWAGAASLRAEARWLTAGRAVAAVADVDARCAASSAAAPALCDPAAAMTRPPDARVVRPGVGASSPADLRGVLALPCAALSSSPPPASFPPCVHTSALAAAASAPRPDARSCSCCAGGRATAPSTIGGVARPPPPPLDADADAACSAVSGGGSTPLVLFHACCARPTTSSELRVAARCSASANDTAATALLDALDTALLRWWCWCWLCAAPAAPDVTSGELCWCATLAAGCCRGRPPVTDANSAEGGRPSMEPCRLISDAGRSMLARCDWPAAPTPLPCACRSSDVSVLCCAVGGHMKDEPLVVRLGRVDTTARCTALVPADGGAVPSTVADVDALCTTAGADAEPRPASPASPAAPAASAPAAAAAGGSSTQSAPCSWLDGGACGTASGRDGASAAVSTPLCITSTDEGTTMAAEPLLLVPCGWAVGCAGRAPGGAAAPGAPCTAAVAAAAAAPTSSSCAELRRRRLPTLCAVRSAWLKLLERRVPHMRNAPSPSPSLPSSPSPCSSASSSCARSDAPTTAAGGASRPRPLATLAPLLLCVPLSSPLTRVVMAALLRRPALLADPRVCAAVVVHMCTPSACACSACGGAARPPSSPASSASASSGRAAATASLVVVAVAVVVKLPWLAAAAAGAAAALVAEPPVVMSRLRPLVTALAMSLTDFLRRRRPASPSPSRSRGAGGSPPPSVRAGDSGAAALSSRLSLRRCRSADARDGSAWPQCGQLLPPAACDPPASWKLCAAPGRGDAGAAPANAPGSPSPCLARCGTRGLAGAAPWGSRCAGASPCPSASSSESRARARAE